MIKEAKASNSFKMPHIDICLCTYKRPELLDELLDHLATLETGDLFTYSIIVVDNNSAQSAKNVVDSHRTKGGITITYACEPIANVARARNLALKLSSGNYVAFIDDDERPEKDWLLRLFRALSTTGADAIMGPVYPFYTTDPPAWVRKGRFFLRSFPPSGPLRRWQEGRTGNLLIKSSVIKEYNVSFNPEFSRGGEDQDFTRQLMEKGYKIFWFNGAPLIEMIGPHRWNFKFMFRKALVRGAMSARYPLNKPVAFIRTIMALPVYSLALPFLLLLGYDVFTSYLIKIGDHAGRLLEWTKIARKMNICHE